MWVAIVTFVVVFLVLLGYVCDVYCFESNLFYLRNDIIRNLIIFFVLGVGTLVTIVHYEFVFSDWDNVSAGFLSTAWALWLVSTLIEMFIKS